MELRHLRYFVAVAGEKNFTRAAELLGLQQPPLSQQIRQLENELGSPLFVRLTRGVELTEAGKGFLQDAQAILAQVEMAKIRVERIGRGEVGQIRLGVAGATYFQPRVTEVILAFREACPDVRLLPVQSNTSQLIGKLAEGEVDVAFVRPPVEMAQGWVLQPLVEEDMLLVLPGGHELARQPEVALTDVAADNIILFPREISPGLYDNVMAAFHLQGISPRLGQEAPQIMSIVPMVAAGFGVALVPRSVSQIKVEGVVYLPVKGGGPQAPISLAYPAEGVSAVVQQFVEVARGML